MSEIKFKAGKNFPNPADGIAESDIVMVNDTMGDTEADETAKGFGSVYKGTRIVGTTKANELRLTEDLTVMGTNVGNIANGDKLEKGASIEKILKMMLQKEIGLTTSNPTKTVSISPSSAQEVGIVVDVTLTATFTDGKIKSEDSSLWVFEQAAGCVSQGATWKKGSATVTSPYTLTVAAGDNTFNVSIPYTGVTATLPNNLGEDQTVTIADGTLTDSKTIKGYYKYFHGAVSDKNTAVENIDIRALANNALFDGSSETISSVKCPAGGLYVLACPEGRSLSSISNSMNIAYDKNDFGDLFAKANGVVKSIKDGGSGNYNVKVYILQNDGGTEQEYKNIIFK